MVLYVSVIGKALLSTSNESLGGGSQLGSSWDFFWGVALYITGLFIPILILGPSPTSKA